MNKKLTNTKNSNDCEFLNQPRKSKKRSGSRKSSYTSESWFSNDRDSPELSEDEVPGMEYTFWHHHSRSLHQAQPSPVYNEQRLYAAMSDPSVCGYSAVPVTYAVEPVSLPPMYHLYQPVVRSSYRPYRGKTRSALKRMQNGPPCNNEALGNGYSSLQENGWNHSTLMTYQNGDYASLPPTANINNKDNGDELNSEHRRYSDPGLGPANIPSNSKSEDTDSAESGSSITTVGKNNKLFLQLVEQMTKMKEMSNQLFKELHQTKSELEIVKTELNNFKQNIPSEYQPGMLTDIIKEIRDASRSKEESMISKMKFLIESQQNQKSIDLEQLKNQLDDMQREKKESSERIGKLEKEVATLKLNLNSENREIAAFEEENLALRRELQEARASRNLAESHATKCVNAAVAVRPVTPVNFDSPYSPCITSTPVRTTFDSTSTDPSSSVASLHSTDVNHELLEFRCSASVSPIRTDSSLSLQELGLEKLDDPECTLVASSSTERLLPSFTKNLLLNKEVHFLCKDSEFISPTCNNVVADSTCESPSEINRSQESSSDDTHSETVVGGNSVVSKDLCSANILTSRVLTAPSRATYTTAYI